LSDTGEIWEYNETVHQPCIDFNKVYDSVRRELFYNILIEFWGIHEISQIDENAF
jgi:hypothetical protein